MFHALTILFNRSFNEELLPEDWKKASVIPIFKKDEISDPEFLKSIIKLDQ